VNVTDASPHPESAPERKPLSVYGVGSEPDVRFSLANERTALAWVRAGLTLVAGGVAVTTLAAFADLGPILDVLAAFACLSGGALAISALYSWRRNERALRLGQPLPAPVALPWLIVGVSLLAVFFAVYAILEATKK
jgi:putative membrane protein